MADGEQAGRATRDKEYVVAKTSDIPPGGRVIVTVRDREVGIFNVDGEFHAILNRCPHRGGELCKGDVLGLVTADVPGDLHLDASKKFIVCPWHGWEFDLATGEAWRAVSEGTDTRKRYADARLFGVAVRHGSAVEQELARGETELSVGSAAVFEPGTHRVKGQFEAEIYPVRLEDDYVVISLRRLTTTNEDKGD